MSSRFFKTSETSGINVIELSLPTMLDAAEFDELNQSMLSAIDSNSGGKWILDLTAASYMGSAMLGLMVNMRQHVVQGSGKLVLCCLSPRLMEVFRACSLERLFTIATGRDEALAALGRR